MIFKIYIILLILKLYLYYELSFKFELIIMYILNFIASQKIDNLSFFINLNLTFYNQYVKKFQIILFKSSYYLKEVG